MGVDAEARDYFHQLPDEEVAKIARDAEDAAKRHESWARRARNELHRRERRRYVGGEVTQYG